MNSVCYETLINLSLSQPQHWNESRALVYQMIDDMLNLLVWYT